MVMLSFSLIELSLVLSFKEFHLHVLAVFLQGCDLFLLLSGLLCLVFDCQLKGLLL